MSLQPLGGAIFWDSWNFGGESKAYGPGNYPTLQGTTPYRRSWEDNFDAVKIACLAVESQCTNIDTMTTVEEQVLQNRTKSRRVFTQFRIWELMGYGFWDKISSLKVECDGPAYCTKNPKTSNPDCTSICKTAKEDNNGENTSWYEKSCSILQQSPGEFAGCRQM